MAIKPDADDQIRVGIDRIQIGAADRKEGPPVFKGFQLRSDRFLRNTMPIKAWKRLARYEDAKSGAQLCLKHEVECSWLPGMKATLIAGSGKTLSREIIENAFFTLERARVLLLELSFDFPPPWMVDRSFVRRHGIFGKSRRRSVDFSTLYYGGQDSDKLIRAYDKAEVSAFRVEFEFHASWLIRHKLTQPTDLVRLPAELEPYLNFSEIDWSRLENYLLVAKGRKDAIRILQEARARSADISEVLSYLRQKGILNTHRLIQSLSINKDILNAAHGWARKWTRHA